VVEEWVHYLVESVDQYIDMTLCDRAVQERKARDSRNLLLEVIEDVQVTDGVDININSSDNITLGFPRATEKNSLIDPSTSSPLPVESSLSKTNTWTHLVPIYSLNKVQTIRHG
jgi:hypothetical protein